MDYIGTYEVVSCPHCNDEGSIHLELGTIIKVIGPNVTVPRFYNIECENRAMYKRVSKDWLKRVIGDNYLVPSATDANGNEWL